MAVLSQQLCSPACPLTLSPSPLVCAFTFRRRVSWFLLLFIQITHDSVHWVQLRINTFSSFLADKHKKWNEKWKRCVYHYPVDKNVEVIGEENDLQGQKNMKITTELKLRCPKTLRQQKLETTERGRKGASCWAVMAVWQFVVRFTCWLGVPSLCNERRKQKRRAASSFICRLNDSRGAARTRVSQLEEQTDRQTDWQSCLGWLMGAWYCLNTSRALLSQTCHQWTLRSQKESPLRMRVTSASKPPNVETFIRHAARDF